VAEKYDRKIIKRMYKKLYWKNSALLHTCLINLLIILGMSGCSSRPEPQKTKNNAAVFHGSRFEAFTLKLKALPENEHDPAVKLYLSEFPKTPVYEADSIFSLYWFGKAKQILLYGDLQAGWSVPDTLIPIPCGESAFFHATYVVPPDARLDYQFEIDSVFMTDERNPVITPSGYGLHSQIAMPGFKPKPVRQYRKDIPHGTIDSLMLISQDPGIRARQAKVYLPAAYNKLSQLPVLYVLDGLEAMEYMSYPSVLDNLIADGKIEPAMAVFIPPAERDNEFMGDQHQAFMAALCDEWVPIIDNTYKTANLPGKRGVTGISSGGHLALLTVLSRPDIFLCGAGQSPTLSDEIYDALHVLQKEVKTNPALHIYFDIGRFDLVDGTIDDETFLKANEDLHQVMEREGIPHVFHVFNDGHEWANWRERTDEILNCFFGN